MAREVGAAIGALDEALARGIEMEPIAIRPALGICRDSIVRELIGKVLSLCKWSIPPEAAGGDRERATLS